MNRKLRDDPIIVLSTHHSGTSLIAEVLHRSGVFMQANRHHCESKFFARDISNRLIMGNSANRLRNPIMPVDEVMSKLEVVRERIEKKAYKKYVEAGYDGYSRWGFNDPCACIVLPLYLEIFPNAQLLHVIRNENAVAAVLAANNNKAAENNPDMEFWKDWQRQLVARAREYGSKHRQYFEFHYEDFCWRPVKVTKEIFNKLGLIFTGATEQFLRGKNLLGQDKHWI
ncbi:MAG: sulfotransferase [candidate division KSB1 bacterium]|nr:sulfotransferase [candidate division KSB1 bacterium]MDZ7302416.1 sulfotransferase [candidate division KSB1 bacterium]MDZ7311618.1 sulfotransferase [candidate division KSB1 bacterium]